MTFWPWRITSMPWAAVIKMVMRKLATVLVAAMATAVPDKLQQYRARR